MALYRRSGIVVFFLVALSSATSSVSAVEQKQHVSATPVTKIIQLLQDMLAKGKKEIQQEEIHFSAFKQFCGDKTGFKQKAIETATARIGELNAQIQQADADIQQLSDEVTELDEDVSRWETDITAATNVRNGEAADFKATAADYQETLDALDKAIRVLKDRSADVPQTLLLQISKLPRVPEGARKAISAFLQQGEEPLGGEESYNGMAVAAPEANAYEFQSGGIIDMLEKLKDKFRGEKQALEEEELNAKHAFEQMTQELNDSIENAKAETGRRQKSRAERVQNRADAKGDLDDTTADKESDSKYLADLQAMCAQKGEDYENRQKLRAEELEVLQKVIEILSGDAGGTIQKHADTYLNGAALLQTKKKGKKSLVQLRNTIDRPVQGRVAEFLSDRANELNSKLLSMVAVQVAADPFVKVKKMIKDLIVKLMEEATEEAEAKGWCDTELTTNQQTRDQKTSEVDELTATTTELTAQIAQLQQEVTQLTADVAEIDEAVAKATSDRDAEKAKNTQTIADAKEAQEACEQALAVLKEFYDKAAQATSMLQTAKKGMKKQTPREEAPETFNTPYKGMMAEGGGPMDFLEVIQSDFVRLESETKTAEDQAAEEFEKFLFDSRMDKEMKLNDVKHKEEKIASSQENLAMAKKDLKVAREELDAALAYYEKLKPKCVSSGISFEDRVQRRKEEIQSLQEALKILTGMDI